MRIFFPLTAMLAFFAAAPAMAQGTAAQREACEDDARRLCDAQIPDAIAVERCLRANIGALTQDCRAQFGEPAATPAPRKRGGKRK
jgi:hypothetical protein